MGHSIWVDTNDFVIAFDLKSEEFYQVPLHPTVGTRGYFILLMVFGRMFVFVLQV